MDRCIDLLIKKMEIAVYAKMLIYPYSIGHTKCECTCVCVRVCACVCVTFAFIVYTRSHYLYDIAPVSAGISI